MSAKAVEIKKRDETIDVLRFIGISLIILAHIYPSPPKWICEIRRFDVPLMVFISGLCYSRKDITNYYFFVWKRIQRLVFPVWIFFAFYFGLNYLLFSNGVTHWFPSGRQILETFLLQEGIGYVWIIRVFLLITLIAPFLIKLEASTGYMYYGITLGICLLSAILTNIHLPNNALTNAITYTVGYAPLFMVGLRIKQVSAKEQRTIFGSLALLFGSLIGIGVLCRSELSLLPYKYPPQLPYILYGLTLSCLLFLVGKHLLWFLGNRLTTWIGGNTIWIYLWHIFSIRFFARISNVWLIQYIIVYTSALLIYALQYWMTNSLFKDKQIKRFLVG